MIDRLRLDVRHGLRLLRRSPGFTAVAVLVLAVGIGVNTAAFSLIDALLFKPLPIQRPEELVRLVGSGVDGGISYPDYLDYRRSVRSLSGVIAFTADTVPMRFAGGHRPEQVAAYLVSDNYFEVLAAPPVVGRGLGRTPGDEDPAVVLSHAFWSKRFDKDPTVLGRPLWLGGTAFRIAGVAPEGFTGTMRGGAPNVFVPLEGIYRPDELSARGRRSLIAIGRLAPHVAPAAAQAELGQIARRLADAFPDTNRNVPPVAVGLEKDALFREAPQLRYVVAAVLAMFWLLLAVACVNLAGLLTARASFRQREMAIRAMHGASRRAIVSQLLTESVLLASLGGIAGLVVGVWARNLLWNRLQSTMADHLGMDALGIDTSIDVRTTLFTIGISAASVLLFGLLPALYSSRNLYTRAKEDPSSPSPAHLSRMRRFVGAQVMLSTLLLAIAGLLVQTVRNAAAADLGYPLEGAYTADLDLAAVDKDHVNATLDRLLTAVRRLPGLEAAAIEAFAGPGYLPQSATPGRPRQNYVLASCGPSYFTTLRVPILSGREFDDRDAAGGTPVAILNERLAHRLWPSQDVIGRQLKVWDDSPPVTVVGVSKTIRTFPIGPPFYQIYLPFAQQAFGSKVTAHLRLAPRHTDAPARVLAEIRRVTPEVEAVRIRAVADWMESLLAIPRALVTALGSLGVAALFLASVGLYGVTAYVAGRRARECAIRVALGASRLSILWLVARAAMHTILIGLGIGSLLALSVGFLLKSALLGSAFDPVALVLAPAVLGLTALIAIAVPVARASSVDTMVVLRED